MNWKIERKWALFIAGLTLTVSGCLTKFRYRGALDIQIHDTYYVIHNSHLVIVIATSIIMMYLAALGLKYLARINKILKVITIIINGLITLGLITILGFTLYGFGISHSSATFIVHIGIGALITGITLMFILRMKEIILN